MAFWQDLYGLYTDNELFWGLAALYGITVARLFIYVGMVRQLSVAVILVRGKK